VQLAASKSKSADYPHLQQQVAPLLGARCPHAHFVIPALEAAAGQEDVVLLKLNLTGSAGVPVPSVVGGWR